MKTPFFLIDKAELDKNIANFKIALGKIWPNSKIAYSVKTNSLPWLLKYLKTQGVMAEVVSDEEYELAMLCGFREKEIVFNGPIKGEEAFLNSIRKESIVNLDSREEVRFFGENFKNSKWNVGVRVNVDTSLFDDNDVGYIEDGFRFGFSEENKELNDVINVIRFNNNYNKIGLHLHCNSITRSLSVYRELARYISYIIEKFKVIPSFIDIGGGFFGGVEGKPSATEYIQVIYEALRDIVNPNDTMLIVEPGSAIIGSAVEFHTSVLDVKDTNKSRIVTTDGSRINIDPLWSKSRYKFRVTTKNYSDYKIDKQIICGYTCMDHDRIMALVKQNELARGDKIIYEKVGAYTMTFGGPFIRYFPEVYMKDMDTIELVRKRMSVNDYYKIQDI